MEFFLIYGPVAQLDRATAFRLGAGNRETVAGILADQESLRKHFFFHDDRESRYQRDAETVRQTPTCCFAA
jgi:hypothetical protein